MKHIDGFGVNIKEFEKFMLMKQWFSRCMEKAAKTEKPFRAILEYNPKRRHMAIWRFFLSRKSTRMDIGTNWARVRDMITLPKFIHRWFASRGKVPAKYSIFIMNMGKAGKV